MSTTLPNIPYASPVADESGRLAPIWSRFFTMLYARMGDAVALSNKELEVLHDASLVALQTQVNTLENTVTALQVQVSTGLSDLGQGPTL